MLQIFIFLNFVLPSQYYNFVQTVCSNCQLISPALHSLVFLFRSALPFRWTLNQDYGSYLHLCKLSKTQQPDLCLQWKQSIFGLLEATNLPNHLSSALYHPEPLQCLIIAKPLQ
ncbi:hypothetical protein KP509_16G006000 [Ceratopteris richardii]|uniref:Uncharacterized protein n=1 Tax=Ceratopteris richardii TaxID=49495 RepID=A0A8T2T0J1_CERRI|nr:hypothetical protein KP509_16G006000 [Ceratopteris richardii]